MGTTMHVEVVSVEEPIYSGPAEYVIAPGVEGELGIYPRHTPLLTRVKPGALRIKIPLQAEEELVYVSGGILEVQPQQVTVLSDTAVRAHDLDEAKALEAKKAAEEAMRNKTSKLELAKAQAELAEAMAQISAIRKLRKK
ncbi:MAG TPA: F0F1 ATP synthase subunit epsilon [Burkholderiales bacterium]|nr:F0F1 ATP synthase subunit epsilon [Burkholderiales bacterium]